MNKSTWVIDVKLERWAAGPLMMRVDFFWHIRNRAIPSSRFTSDLPYTRRDSALRGARRMAKRLGIWAEVEK